MSKKAGGDYPLEEWYAPVPRSIASASLAGALVIGLAFAGFGGWAATAPLAAAVVASGTFVSTGQNKLVQHLEGGIIREIRAREGDRVDAGQTLLVLDSVAPRANARRLSIRFARLQAASDRLSAQAAGREALVFRDVRLNDADGEEIEQIQDMQRRLFDAALAQLKGNEHIVEGSIQALRERLKGVEAQKAAVSEQLRLILKEREGKATLQEKGLLPLSRLFEMDRVIAEARGMVGKLEGDEGDLKSQIARHEAEIAQLRQETRQRAGDELQTVNSDLDDIREQLAAASDVLGRVEIRSPVAGIIVKFNYNTIGGVIESGKDILEILPENEDLIIEAPVKPSDIDDVALGQAATVNLTSFNRRTTPAFTGTVIYVSADTIRGKDRDNPKDVYLVRVLLDDKHLAQAQELHITPGMPAEIFIETASRTFLDYITKPVRDSMGRAFRES
ncbi:HlyD family type I secretion periplasmic adaptor subunit [Afifella marina]|uniref:Membrane fusion protein (MFP) family protein n=1 Tax=Afifella marina DSM 2698 TaxID=1120955 RepID=A0A1G5P6F8_AFIMA|nr:HlyD family type I secretion periplasmic adaptor subunit [Afifella marina]MBK1625120.1 HlyD family type I secretion periplasmic adaptor subunit [Afifella marina DSM 2698]MBK1627024.1 HlyD family type I secretion periplasmic adaptor subunit [Afifella marina]MBK5919361.1 hypothetical protein [Afifella marina]RAI19587.1 hypothetical protein CH311_12335 [Afifella marina DSM 2698]SCZ44709.1 HlyD family secretion protein [Afifella marina DSM 2698]